MIDTQLIMINNGIFEACNDHKNYNIYDMRKHGLLFVVGFTSKACRYCEQLIPNDSIYIPWTTVSTYNNHSALFLKYPIT